MAYTVGQRKQEPELRQRFFGVKARDPIVFVVVPALLGLVHLIAIGFPQTKRAE